MNEKGIVTINPVMPHTIKNNGYAPSPFSNDFKLGNREKITNKIDVGIMSINKLIASKTWLTIKTFFIYSPS